MFEEISDTRKYRYARLCSKPNKYNSSFEFQKQEFLKLGVPERNIWVEVGSVVDNIKDRPVFYNLIDNELTQNDLLFVTKMDRCSKNTLEFLKLQEHLHQKGVIFISLDLPYVNDIVINKISLTYIAAMANVENERRKERQCQGIKAAKKAGKCFRRKTVITQKLTEQVRDLKENKNLSITQIAKIIGRGRSTICKVLKENLYYVPYNRLVKQQSQNDAFSNQNHSEW